MTVIAAAYANGTAAMAVDSHANFGHDWGVPSAFKMQRYILRV